MPEILRKGAASIALRAAGAVLTFGLHILIGRFYGTTGIGAYLLAVTIITLVALICRAGLDHTVTRLVALPASDPATPPAGSVMRAAIGGTMLACVVATAILWLLADPLARVTFDDPRFGGHLRIVSLALLPLAVAIICSRALQGRRFIADSMLADSVVIPAVAVAVIALAGNRFGVDAAFVAYVSGTVAAASYAAWRWRQVGGLASAGSDIRWASLAGSSLPLLGMAVTQQIALVAPLLLLGAFAPADQVGLFGAAQRTAGLLGMVLIAANSIVAPKFASLHASGDIDSLSRVARQSFLVLSIAIAPVVVVLLAFPATIMALFGPEFAAAENLLRLMVIGQAFSIMTGSVGYLLIMSDHARDAFQAAWIVAAFAILLGLLLIPRFGAAGAAITSMAALIGGNLIRLLAVWRRIGIVATPFLPDIRQARP